MRRWIILPVLAACAMQTPADTVTMTSGRVVEGTVVQETGTQVTVLLEYGTITLPRSIIAKIEKKPTAPAVSAATAKTRIPLAAVAVQKLGQQRWATELRQIPATVIDRGIMRHVPYQSYRAGGDYELNIYGDPDDPAGIEIGIYRGLLDSTAARPNCLRLLASLLSDPADAAMLKDISAKQDAISRNGLTVEVTQPTAPDAYGGWWVSVYDSKKLDAARATPKELAEITTPRTTKEDQTRVTSTTPPARDAATTTTTPPPARDRSTTSARRSDDDWLAWTLDDLARARKQREEEEARRQQQTTTTTGSTGGGSVYVRAYHRKDGTYVRGHTRRR